jgi:hypothetical protein
MTTTSRSQLLSTLWIFVLMNMIYADIIGMLRPGYLDLLDSMSRQLAPGVVLVFAILLEVPILLILLSRILPRTANRAANLTAVPISILYVIFGGLDDPPLSYLLFASIEILAMLVIFYLAWNWKAHSKQTTMSADA